MQTKQQDLYEKFHSVTRRQKKIIDKNDFTLGEFIGLLEGIKIKNKKIIDFGCGTGAIDFYLASLGGVVTGIDISKKAIRACNRDAKALGVGNNVRFYVKNLLKISSKSKYDIALCLEVIEHIHNEGRLLKIVTKSLRIGGILIISTPSKNAPLYRMGFLNKFDKRVGHLRRYNMTEILKKIEEYNFSALKKMKTEGVLRNFLFTSKIGGVILKAVNKFRLGPVVTDIDKLFLHLFGESDLIIVARKR